MKIVTAQKMREIDQESIEVFGIPEIILMENAGVQVKGEMEQLLGGLQHKKICVCCGCGNNGGDGFVAARHMANQGARVKVFLLGDISHLGPSAQTNLDILVNMNVDVLELAAPRDWDKTQVALAFADGIVDGLLGTGFKGELRPEMEKFIQIINEVQKPVVAIDLPSGIGADDGTIQTLAVNASATVSFGLPKLGLFFYPGAQCVGKLMIDGIGIPKQLLEDSRINQQMMDIHCIQKILLKREGDVHKNSCGRVLAIAGSQGFTGAAALVSQSALRSGAGVVTLAVAQSLQDIMAVKLTEVMTRAVPEKEKGKLGKESLSALLDLAIAYDTVVIGPGLGRDEDTAILIRDFVAKVETQLVLDADAIVAFAGYAHLLRDCKITPILTPHLGEMAKLLGVSVAELREDRIGLTRDAAKDYNCIFVLKSERTIVVFPDGTVSLSTNGNPGMATAGSGDVLAGVIAGLKAQGMSRYNAAMAGVFLHGFAGDLAAERGMTGLVASDIMEALPAARFALGNE
jgi:hydroxyethylthiazole kinase-like uncharacterized protein yjeF